jgi:hypothetical protein
MQTPAVSERCFLATGQSHPLSALELIGAPAAAKILGRTSAMFYQQRRRGRFVVEPVAVVDGNKLVFDRAAVLRAKELLTAKPETPRTQ